MIKLIIKEHNSDIFYHNSDKNIIKFEPDKHRYIFFSKEENSIIFGKFTYKVKLTFNPLKNFNRY